MNLTLAAYRAAWRSLWLLPEGKALRERLGVPDPVVHGRVEHGVNAGDDSSRVGATDRTGLQQAFDGGRVQQLRVGNALLHDAGQLGEKVHARKAAPRAEGR